MTDLQDVQPIALILPELGEDVTTSRIDRQQKMSMMPRSEEMVPSDRPGLPHIPHGRLACQYPPYARVSSAYDFRTLGGDPSFQCLKPSDIVPYSHHSG